VAVEGQMRRGIEVSAETLRHGLHEVGWAWKRAKVTAKDEDPERVTQLARIRPAVGQLRAGAARFVADELDIHVLPQLGSQWMPKGKQVAVMTPGPNAKRSLAGALTVTTGRLPPWVWDRKQPGLFLALLDTLDRRHPAPRFTQLTVGVENAHLHKAPKMQQWLTAHPRFEGRYLPTYCPRATPLARAFGDSQDNCTRTHTRKRLWHLGQEVKQLLRANGPWRYALSALYYTPEVTAGMETLRTAQLSPPALSQLAA
jgi:DDE superfamily endonuclease